MKKREDEKPKSTNWGGRREGAGRPSTDSKLFTFRAPGTVAKIIEGQPNKTEFILDSIKKNTEPMPNIGEMYRVMDIKDITLPYFDQRVVAGFPIPLDNDEKAQDIELLKMLCPHPEASYLIRVQGNSMIDANINDGDILIIDKSNRNPAPHEPAMCEHNGEYTIKFVQEHDGKPYLVPANEDYPMIPITEGDSFSVWGTVTYIIHKPSPL